MATSTTSSVYIHVIEDVINKVREEFVNTGAPENVLLELQGMWETKLMAAGAVLGPIDRSAAQKPVPAGGPTPVHDLNVPYEGTEEYETPTAEMLFPPTPLQTPIQTPLPGTADNSYNIPTGPSEYGTPGPENGSGATSDTKAGRPSPYMPPPSPWINQRPPLDVNVAYEENREEADRGNSQQPATQDFFQPTGKRKREDVAPQQQAVGVIPQHDGASDAVTDAVELEITMDKYVDSSENLKAAKGKMVIEKGSSSRIPQVDGPVSDPYENMLSTPNITIDKSVNSSDILRAAKGKMVIEKGSSSRIPQMDGPVPDPYEDMLSTPNIYGVVNEDYNVVNTPASDLPPAIPAPVPAAVAAPNDGGDDDDDEEPLNENDDDEVDDVDQGEELNTQHLVLAQFDKVTRTKSRWKCTLKDGIMHINNKDILFNKATGEFDF